MIELVNNPVVIDGAALQSAEEARAKGVDLAAARSGTLAARILDAHNTAPQGEDVLRIRFDALASHDITYVGIIQTARASGLKEFPLPYALTNCHNSLCAVGGTINEDDHSSAWRPPANTAASSCRPIWRLSTNMCAK
jgi:aconitate hydratase